MNEKKLIIVGDQNIDIRQDMEKFFRDDLDLLAEFERENVLYNCTREHHLGASITKSHVYHVMVSKATEGCNLLGVPDRSRMCGP